MTTSSITPAPVSLPGESIPLIITVDCSPQPLPCPVITLGGGSIGASKLSSATPRSSSVVTPLFSSSANSTNPTFSSNPSVTSAIGTGSSTSVLNVHNSSTYAPLSSISPSSTHAPGLPIGVIIPVAVILGLSFVGGALLVTCCVLKRRRRANQQPIRVGDRGARRTRYRASAVRARPDIVERTPSPTSIIAVPGATQTDCRGTTSGQDGNALARSSSGAFDAWNTLEGPTIRRTKPEPTSSRPRVVHHDSPRAHTQLPPREVPISPAAEDPDTVLLRLPADLARGIMALVAGAAANAGEVRYAVGSEDGEGSESLPAYESQPSRSEVNGPRAFS